MMGFGFISPNVRLRDLIVLTCHLCEFGMLGCNCSGLGYNVGLSSFCIWNDVRNIFWKSCNPSKMYVEFLFLFCTLVSAF